MANLTDVTDSLPISTLEEFRNESSKRKFVLVNVLVARYTGSELLYYNSVTRYVVLVPYVSIIYKQGTSGVDKLLKAVV